MYQWLLRFISEQPAQMLLAASDPGIGGEWGQVIRDSIFALALVTVVLASYMGWVTWPPERRRLEATIATLTEALKEANANTQRTLPATARVVELVEQRVSHPQPAPETPASTKIDRDVLLAALREVAESASKVVNDEQG